MQIIDFNRDKSSLWEFKPLKAPGPNVLHPVFFRNCWDTTEPSFSKLIKGCFQFHKTLVTH